MAVFPFYSHLSTHKPTKNDIIINMGKSPAEDSPKTSTTGSKRKGKLYLHY